MKRLILALVMVGCTNVVHNPTPKRTAPSLGDSKALVRAAQDSNTRATVASNQLDTNLTRARTLQERIDFKATLLLERRRK